jgi:lysophospholipid acyltransferase (LPLAT)-like uncharacterized protein
VSRSAPLRAALRAVVPPLAATLIRATWASCRVTWIRRPILEDLLRDGTPFILAFWHSRLWFMPHAVLGKSVTAFISASEDGELIARTMARLGHGAARGSSTRAGDRAFRTALRVARAGGSLAITPDGPKGPPCVVKPGVVELARATGFPILPCSLAHAHALRLRSWDRFEVPAPFSRVAIAYGAPRLVARETSRAVREQAARDLGTELDALTAECERSLGTAAPRMEAVP